jgi:hypothetical protein
MRIAGPTLKCIALLVVSLPLGATGNGRPPPTASLAKQVRSLNMLLSDSPPGTTMESRRRAGFVVRDRISEFIVDQMDANPDILQSQLRKQLQAILCSSPNDECDCDHPPYVLGNVWGGKKGIQQFVVAYVLYLGFMGPQGSITVVEGYLSENGKVRSSSRGGAEFDGYMANFQMVEQFSDPNEIWLLAWGTIQGASGRGLHGRATVYSVGADSVKLVWDAPNLDNVTAQRNAVGWEVAYADPTLLYGNDPKPYFLDIYEVTYLRRAFSRVVHFQHPED